MSATITFTDQRIAKYIEQINQKDPYSGSIVTSGPTSIKDSSWLLGYSISRQPHFKEQKKNESLLSVYSLYTDRKGDYVAKRPDECTGIEMCEEWLYHIGVPENTIHELACSASTILAICLILQRISCREQLTIAHL